ncbi:predicted protein [Histoplasma capsulatum G186AR]|uniref:Uncharacterized protein n=1 Tax=Ajellomyces capsulatus (strain G186AR / H82 / ATCC MYA-2454 / RMSCC 2432) TaxID=447093 RepID=C0NDV4_AJECG|nr:uncharacterized protein HCBG_02047 [Histoplasma capsulatum G186AR]EEH10402.1 predicted protein [Histoplasma capsulatum G186AR]
MGLPNVKPYLLMPLLFDRCVSDAIQPLLAALPYEPNGWDIKFLRMLARNGCFYSAGQEVVNPLSKASGTFCFAGDKTAFGFEFVGVETLFSTPSRITCNEKRYDLPSESRTARRGPSAY